MRLPRTPHNLRAGGKPALTVFGLGEHTMARKKPTEVELRVANFQALAKTRNNAIRELQARITGWLAQFASLQQAAKELGLELDLEIVNDIHQVPHTAPVLTRTLNARLVQDVARALA